MMFETCKIKKKFNFISIILIQFNYIDYKINMTERERNVQNCNNSQIAFKSF